LRLLLHYYREVPMDEIKELITNTFIWKKRGRKTTFSQTIFIPNNNITAKTTEIAHLLSFL